MRQLPLPILSKTSQYHLRVVVTQATHARTRCFSAVIRFVNAPPALQIDGDGRTYVQSDWAGPGPPAGRARSSAGPILLDPRVVREATSLGRSASLRVILLA